MENYCAIKSEQILRVKILFYQKVYVQFEQMYFFLVNLNKDDFNKIDYKCYIF